MKIIALFAGVLAVTCITGALEIPCKEGWNAILGGCYKLFTTPADWSTAVDECRSNGAYLATIEDPAEAEALGALSQPTGQDTWIGANDLQTSGQFMWEGPRRLVQYSNWVPGEPGIGDQKCVVISWGWDSSNRWDNNHCENAFPFICESRPNDWVTLGPNHIYYMGTDEYDFNTALARCHNLNSELVAIDDAVEDSFVSDFMTNFYPNVDVWIGLTDEAVEDQWLLTDGSASSYTNWAPGQPDNGRAQNCATYSWGWAQTTEWDDNICYGTFPYICEA